MSEHPPDDQWNSENHRTLVAMVDELREIAHRIMRRHQGLTIQPTMLANDAILALGQHESLRSPMERAELLGRCVTTMSRILKDHLRSRRALKRGGAVGKVALDEWIEPLRNADIDELQFLEIVEELKTLGSERQYQIAFGKILLGQTLDELSALLDLPRETIEKELEAARKYLRHRLRPSGET